MKLRELQDLMALSIVKNAPSADLLERLQPGGSLPGALEAWRVYRQGYPARLSEALGETYEAVWSVLGDEGFFALCDRYLSAHPSQNYNLSNYGGSVPRFLEADASSTEFPFLPELAAFEWEFHELFHKAPSPVRHRSPEALASIDGDTRFRLIPALRLFRFSYGVHSIWKKRGGKEQTLESPVLHRSESVILFKSGSQMLQSMTLETEQYEILHRLADGQTLQNALESVQDENSVGSLFSLMARHGLIAEILKG